MASEVVDCALTERARKKLERPRKRKRGKDENSQAEEAEESKKPGRQERRGVIYVGHIPHGFYEDEMRKYFSQFGTVTRLKLSRSRKTGRSRGYAFIEFEFQEVAAIAAETMNNYLMFDKLLKCHVVDPERVHSQMFRNSYLHVSERRTQQLAQREHNRPRSVAESQKRLSRLLSRERRKRRRLEELGLDYHFPGYHSTVGTRGVQATHITFTDEEEEEEEEEEMEEVAESE